jgi:hypothetical protein
MRRQKFSVNRGNHGTMRMYHTAHRDWNDGSDLDFKTNGPWSQQEALPTVSNNISIQVKLGSAF